MLELGTKVVVHLASGGEQRSFRREKVRGRLTSPYIGRGPIFLDNHGTQIVVPEERVFKVESVPPVTQMPA